MTTKELREFKLSKVQTLANELVRLEAAMDTVSKEMLFADVSAKELCTVNEIMAKVYGEKRARFCNLVQEIAKKDISELVLCNCTDDYEGGHWYVSDHNGTSLEWTLSTHSYASEFGIESLLAKL
jgi:hypothetical protein